MRRTLALLALLATSWPHVVVLECTFGSAPTAEHQRGAHHHDGGHDRGDAHHASGSAGERTDAPSTAPVGDAQCAMVMACGLVMMQAGGDLAETLGPETRSEPTARASAAPLAVDLSADPPPPRPSA